MILELVQNCSPISHSANSPIIVIQIIHNNSQYHYWVKGKFVISYMLQHAVNLKCTLNPLKDGAKNKHIWKIIFLFKFYRKFSKLCPEVRELTQNGKIINISTSEEGEGRGRESYSKCDLLQLCVDLSNYWDLKLNKKVRVAFLCWKLKIPFSKYI